MTETPRDAWQRKLDKLQIAEASEADAAAKFKLSEQIREAKARLAELNGVPPGDTNSVPAGRRIDIDHLPQGAPHFQGRKDELAALDQAWGDSGRTRVVQLIAPGGTGKTSLVTRWLDSLCSGGWRGAEQVFAWSFYSQGSGEDRQASEDGFLEAALIFFGVRIDAAASPWDKGAKLADAVAARRSLLVLDGMEPLQYPPGSPLAGELKAPGVQTLLKRLAARGQPGLVLITSREHLADLADRVRDGERPDAGVVVLDLGNLEDGDGARLLYKLGVTRAGASRIAAASAADDAELRAASREVGGHALTLRLIGSYIREALSRDVRKRDVVDFSRADELNKRGHAFRAIGNYEKWFEREGEACARQLALVRLVGFFDRPASRENLSALCAPPIIPGLTDALCDLDEQGWNITRTKLEDAGLVSWDQGAGNLDAHPLVREYFAQRLEQDQPEAWREGHRRVYVQLKTDTHTPHRPDGLAGLQPLFQAVAHGCKAGLYQQVYGEVYHDRILRGTGPGGFYSWKMLGAFGAELEAVASFFVAPWHRLQVGLNDTSCAWLYGEAALLLHAVGRLAEALEPNRLCAELCVGSEHLLENASASYSNLSELQLSLGRIGDAVDAARRAVELADRSRNASYCSAFRTTFADARHQAGESEVARCLFAEAELIQAKDQPGYPMLHSLWGFRYCDLLLASAERAAWRGRCEQSDLDACAAVARRSEQALQIVETRGLLLPIALDHLTLARSAFYLDCVQNRPPGDEACRECESAVSGLRAAGQQDDLPRGLLTRAWLRHACGDIDGCRTDLQEVETIASRGGMKLHLADLAFTRARLFHDRAQLQLARELITECGYGRRLPELEDAEARAEQESW
ncbi:MAG: ATP-binding protein [Rhodocyclaceae bacterium]|nr:ATP-binding protein [Rhodocyclaceae bacterium]MBX3668465.1 ATP-binding protein [Rhodocyclaceae bacterium]